MWINGHLTGADGALSAFDHGVTVGDGVFETLKVVVDDAGHRVPFALTRHLRRLRRSADGLEIGIGLDDDALRAAVRAVLDAHGPEPGRLRITVTSGRGGLASDRADGPPTVIVAAMPSAPWPEHAAVATVSWRRNEHSAVAGLKTTSYAENVLALREAHRRGASEAILANTAGQLCEGTGTNIFIGIDGQLVTPPLAAGCLAGITRALVLEVLAATHPVVERDLPIDALARADEAFLTSSTRDVQPISAIDGTPLRTCPGPLTRAAVLAFAELQGRTLDP